VVFGVLVPGGQCAGGPDGKPPLDAFSGLVRQALKVRLAWGHTTSRAV